MGCPTRWSVRRRGRDVRRLAPDYRRHDTVGDFFAFNMFLAFLIAPVVQIVGIGTQLTEAIAGLERTREVLSEQPKTKTRSAGRAQDIEGRRPVRRMSFRIRARKPVLTNVSVRLASRAPSPRSSARRAPASPRSSGWSPRFTTPTAGESASMASISPPSPRLLSHATRGRASGHVPLRRHHPRERRSSPARTPPKRRSSRPAASPGSTNSPSASRKSTTPSSASGA